MRSPGSGCKVWVVFSLFALWAAPPAAWAQQQRPRAAQVLGGGQGHGKGMAVQGQGQPARGLAQALGHIVNHIQQARAQGRVVPPGLERAAGRIIDNLMRRHHARGFAGGMDQVAGQFGGRIAFGNAQGGPAGQFAAAGNFQLNGGGMVPIRWGALWRDLLALEFDLAQLLAVGPAQWRGGGQGGAAGNIGGQCGAGAGNGGPGNGMGGGGGGGVAIAGNGQAQVGLQVGRGRGQFNLQFNGQFNGQVNAQVKGRFVRGLGRIGRDVAGRHPGAQLAAHAGRLVGKVHPAARLARQDHVGRGPIQAAGRAGAGGRVAGGHVGQGLRHPAGRAGNFALHAGGRAAGQVHAGLHVAPHGGMHNAPHAGLHGGAGAAVHAGGHAGMMAAHPGGHAIHAAVHPAAMGGHAAIHPVAHAIAPAHHGHR